MPTTTPTKSCCVCGLDVAQKKRTKDTQGNYYCQECWEAHVEEQMAQRAVSDSDVAEPGPATEASGAEANPSRRRTMALIGAGGLLGLAVIVGTLVFLLSGRWEQQNGDRLLGLKGEADALVAKGNLEGAITKYREVRQLVGDRKISGEYLRGELEAARSSLEQAEAKLSELAKKRQAEEEKAKQAALAAREADKRAFLGVVRPLAQACVDIQEFFAKYDSRAVRENRNLYVMLLELRSEVSRAAGSASIECVLRGADVTGTIYERYKRPEKSPKPELPEASELMKLTQALLGFDALYNECEQDINKIRLAIATGPPFPTEEEIAAAGRSQALAESHYRAHAKRILDFYKAMGGAEPGATLESRLQRIKTEREQTPQP